MTVHIGEVTTIPACESATKEQAAKVLEEAAEVFGAWQIYASDHEGNGNAADEWIERDLIDECADLITATCGLLAGLGVRDMAAAMGRCAAKNRERGRL